MKWSDMPEMGELTTMLWNSRRQTDMFQPPLERNFNDEHYNTTHFHQVLRLRMSGLVPSFPLYAFMACIGTPLLIPLP